MQTENLAPKTVRNYEQAAIGIERRARKELSAQYRDVDKHSLLSPLKILVWFEAQTRGDRYERSSIRYMRNALRFWFTELVARDYPEFKDEALKAAGAIGEIRKPRHVRKKTGDNRKTSARKAKSITRGDWCTLRAFLACRGNILDHTLIMWVECALMTGLRPCEWEHAALDQEDGVTILRVKNAKSTHGRSHGEYRTLKLDYLSVSDINLLEAFLDYLREKTTEIPFETLYDRCKVYLNHANHACWPRRKTSTVCLYTGRHQFAANAKAGGNDSKLIAAYMGHAVDATAGTHYARAPAAINEIRLTPVQEEVDRVRHTKSEFSDRIKQFRRKSGSGDSSVSGEAS